MLFSIFTPTHDPRHLNIVAQSLLDQTFTDFEWVIGLNNGATEADLSILAQFADGPLGQRTRVEPLLIRPGEAGATHVGRLKRMTCGLCRGDYLVELDHDDELTPDALQEIADAIRSHNRPEFVYSDAVHIYTKDHTTQWYGGRYGWKPTYLYHHNNHAYPNNPAFPVSAASLHDIFYAPDHVRVWRADFYWDIGGHDPELAIGDDHDLLQRTYIAGGRMVHIPKVLYRYWLHESGDNTYLLRNSDIQKQQAKNGDKHRVGLIKEWCRRNALERIELGGGQTKETTGVIGVALQGADLNINLLELDHLPFDDHSVGHIHAQDFLEHIPHCRDSSCRHEGMKCVVGLMNEIHRILAPNGWFTSRTPSTGGRGAFQDPTHCSFWNPNSFWYYTRPEQQVFVPGITAKFIAKRVNELHPNQWCRDHDILYVDAVLIALHEEFQPGENQFWRDYNNPF